MIDHIEKYLQMANEFLGSTEQNIYVAQHRYLLFFSRYYLFYWDSYKAVFAGSFASLESALTHGQMYVRN